MIAVEAEAAAAFRRRDWPTVQALLRAYDEPSARLAKAWALVEQGETTAGVERLNTLLNERGALEVSDRLPWTLWNLRKRFGPTALLDWHLHEALIAKLWAQLVDLPVNESNAFAREWVEPALLEFMTALPATGRAPLPWQLAGSMPTLDEAAWRLVLSWLRDRATAMALPQKSAYWALDRTLERSLDASSRARLFGAFAQEARQLLPDHQLLTLSQALDARLLVEDVRARLPVGVRSRVVKVLFRATPRRVLDVALVELEAPKAYGALVRHVVPSGEADKTKAELAWVEGEANDVVAAVPALHFDAGVRAFKLADVQTFSGS